MHKAPTINIDSNWGDKAVSKTLNEPERKLKDTGGPPSDSCNENIQSDVSDEEQKIETAGLEDMNRQKKRLDYRSKTVTFSMDSNKGRNSFLYVLFSCDPLLKYSDLEEEKQDLLKEKKKVVHEVKIHDQMMILFGSILLQCNQFEAAIKVLEEIGLDSCSDRLTHANVLRLICLTFLKDSGDSIYTARSYCERAITKNDQVKCIKGLAICHLLRLHILLKISQKENPDHSAEGGCGSDDLEFEANKNSMGLESLDSISADKIKRTFSQWKTRMKQLTEFDSLPLYKTIFDYVKNYEDNILNLKLDEGEIAEKVMKFWMIPIINTTKEKYTEFEIKRESSNKLQLVLEHHHSAGLQMKPFEVDLNFDIETREALGLDNISELERRDKPSIKSIKIDKLMQLVSNSIYKKLDKGGPKEVTEKTAVLKSDASVQVDTPKALTPLSQPPSIDRFLTPSKYDQILASPSNNKYSTFSEVELQQYRTVDNFERKAMLTISKYVVICNLLI